MTNSQMTENRFKRWADARAKVAAIQAHLRMGGVVMISNHGGGRQYDKIAHAEQFEARKSGAYMRQGRQMVCFDYCSVKFYSYRKAQVA